MYEEDIMEHYQCSRLAATAAMALCGRLNEDHNVATQTFWEWLRGRTPKTKSIDDKVDDLIGDFD
jgi:hypothetical protein